jgi:hypothetical protein
MIQRQEALQGASVITRMHLKQLQHIVCVLSLMWEGRMVATDELPDDEELVDVTQSITYDISVNPASGPELGVTQNNVYEPSTTPGSK